MNLSDYYIGSWKRGGYQDIEGMREKSSNGNLILIEEDATIYVYEDSEYDDVVQLFSEVRETEGVFILKETKGETEDRYFECTVGYELPEQKLIRAIDKDGDILYAVAYLDEDDEIYDTNLTIGKVRALHELIKDMDNDDDIVRIEFIDDANK